MLFCYIKARHWLGYLELELKHANFNEVENIFTRCLKTVLSVDLWKFYLNYIRRINSTEDGKLESDTRTVIEKAYDYVLNNVGIDKDSGPIWSDYIFFLKNAEVNIGLVVHLVVIHSLNFLIAFPQTTNTWEEQRKMDSMRRVYQRAVAIPLNNVEHLWKEYDQWENGLNRLTVGVDSVCYCLVERFQFLTSYNLGEKLSERKIFRVHDSPYGTP